MDEYGLNPSRETVRGLYSPFPGSEGGPAGKESPRPIEILLAEDNPADARFFREALHAAGVRNHLAVVADGEEAMLFLHKRGRYADAPRPDVIVLDLKLPRVSGHAVLAAVKIDPELRSIPIVVLTSSHAPRDHERSYNLEADHYVTKPVGLDVLAGELRIIEALAGRKRA